MMEQMTPEFFDGEVLKWIQISGLTLGEIQYPSECERAAHRHERASFNFPLEGGYIEYQGKRSEECKAFTLSFQPQGHEHSYCGAKTISRAFTIEIEDAWLARLREHSVTLDTPCKLRGGLASWLITRLYNEFRVMEADSSLVIEALALEIAVETSRRKERLSETNPPLWLKQAVELLHDQFAESISLQHIARSVGVHPVHLARVFRQHHHCSVGEYLRRLRVEVACQRMIDSNATLLEIALATGFSDQSQFTHTFKRAIGLTPARFRSQMRTRLR
jgi:AraC family transcriptional regulator